MSLQLFFQLLINGLFFGGVYALLAIGLTLIYGVMKLTNFAHGEMVMLGMYLSFWAFNLFGLDPYISALIVAAIMFVFGGIVQHVLIKRVLDTEPMNQIMVTMGLSTILYSGVQLLWSANTRTVDVAYRAKSFNIGGLILNIPRAVTFVIAMLLALLLYMFIQHSKMGKAMRAASQNRVSAVLMGIDVKKIYILAFGIGTSLAGIGGALITPFQSMDPMIGQQFGTLLFVIVVMGTMGNFLGALIGGMIIGMVETFSGFFIGAQSKQLVTLLLFVVVLLFKPSGIFGGKKE